MRTRMIKFRIDEVIMFLDTLTDIVYTEAEIVEVEKVIAEHDRKAGYNDRMGGFYDKWYRYNRSDSGSAYDEGQRLALRNKKCSGEMTIIPYNFL